MSELPEGWAEAAVADLVDSGGLFDGPFRSNLKTADYTLSGVRVIRLENLAHLRFVEEKRTFISHGKHETLAKHTVGVGDIMFGSFVDDTVRVCQLPRLAEPAIAKADCYTIRPRTDVIDPSYLTLQLAAPQVRTALLEEIHGATRPRITTKQLREVRIPLCPISEQRRIVEKVEALLADVNAARERLAKVPTLLKRFRQSVLAAACSGRLTEDWRTDEFDLATTPLPNLLAEPMANGRSVRDAEHGFPVLRLTCLKNGRIDLAEHKIGAWSAHEASRFLVRRGDFLVARGNGSLRLVGRGGLVNDEPQPVAYPDTLIRLRPKGEIIAPNYLRLVWDSQPVRQQIEELAHTTAGIHKVSQKDLAQVEIPLVPIQEQHEIVRRVDALFALAEVIESRIIAATARADKLTQAILAKAFRGELVPTEAELARRESRNFEPASALLERIRAERERESPKRVHRRRTK